MRSLHHGRRRLTVAVRPAAALLACGAAFALAACGGSDSSEDAGSSASAITPPPAIADAGKVVYCTDATLPPFEFRKGPEMVGSDIDIGKAISKRMGVGAEFAQTGFDGIIAALQAGHCDAIIADMTDTPERAEQVTFVDYGQSGQSILVQPGQESTISTVEDLSGKSAAVQTGSVQRQRLSALNKTLRKEGKAPIDIVAFPSATDAASALRAGQIKAVVSDYPSLAYLAKQDPSSFVVAGEQTNTEPVGIAVEQRNTKLHAAIEAAVKAMYDDGEMAKILETWNISQFALPSVEGQ
jgi:polar amino acid transport system substrate-binding protein